MAGAHVQAFVGWFQFPHGQGFIAAIKDYFFLL
jgi:hypothetical protein